MGLKKAESDYLDSVAAQWGPEHETHSVKLGRLESDYHRYQYCRIQFEKFQAEWWDGQRKSVQDVLLSREQAYERYSAAQRIVIGKQRWGKSAEAKDVAGLEQMWHRWMLGYLQAYEADVARANRMRGTSRPR
jgi:hypothetical protein